MNCNDISRFLDGHQRSALSAAEKHQLEAHVSQCADCAGQWLASESMASFRSEVPPMPAALAERTRQLQDQCESKAAPDQSRRPVIIGSLLLLGAAATMFAVVPGQDASTASQ